MSQLSGRRIVRILILFFLAFIKISLNAKDTGGSHLEYNTENVFKKENILVNEIIAVINNQIITLVQLDKEVMIEKRCNTIFGKKILNNSPLAEHVLQKLINQIIILQLAKESNVKITEKEISNSINYLTSQNNIHLNQLGKRLKSLDVDCRIAYYEMVKNQLIIRKIGYIESIKNINVLSDEVKQYITKHFINGRNRYLLSNIVLSLPKQLEKRNKQKIFRQARIISKSIRNQGTNFSSAIKVYSDAPNAVNSGVINWCNIDTLPLIYKNRINNVRKGKMTLPFSAENNIHIIQLLSKETPDYRRYFFGKYSTQKVVIKTIDNIEQGGFKSRLLKIIDAFDSGLKFFKINDYKYNKEMITDWISLNEHYFLKLKKGTRLMGLNEIARPFLLNNNWQVHRLFKRKVLDCTINYQRRGVAIYLFNRKAQQALKDWGLSLRNNVYIKVFDKH